MILFTGMLKKQEIKRMNRRDFLKSAAAIAAFGVVFRVAGAPKKNVAPKTGGPVDLVAIRGGEPEDMFDRAIGELGGMKAFVKKGQTVVVKPNIGWDRSPELAANTNPKLIERIVKRCYEAGAKQVYVFDTTCNRWDLCYKNSGIAEAAKAAGATVIGGDSSSDRNYLEKNYSKVTVPNAKRLKNPLVHRLIQECDVFINVPVLKHHGGAQMTAAMKNLMGTVSKSTQRFFHQNDLNRCIAEIGTFRKPDLNVIDAYRVMTKRGPRGVDSSDIRLIKYQLLGRDMEALDTAAAAVIGFDPRRIGYIAIGETLGLGTRNLKRLNVKRIKVG